MVGVWATAAPADLALGPPSPHRRGQGSVPGTQQTTPEDRKKWKMELIKRRNLKITLEMKNKEHYYV